MKFSTSAKSFSTAIESAIKFVSGKSTMPILSTIKIEATDKLRLTGFDLSHGIETICDAEIIDTGIACIPAAMIANLAKGLKGQIVIESVDTLITITTLSGSFEIQGMDASDYPELISDMGDIKPCSIDAKLLIQGWKYAATSASIDETKQILQGVNMQVSGGILSMAATDGHRLTVYKMPVDESVDIQSVTVHAKSLGLIPKHTQENVDLSFDSSTCLVDSGSKIITRIFEGKYPDYQLLIPKQFTRSAIVDQVEITDAISLLMSVASENHLCCFTFTDKKLSLSSSRDAFKGNQSIGCKLEGESIDIAFNLKYLLTGLKMFPSNKIKISMNDPLTPVILTGIDLDIDLTHLIMPVQLRF